MSKNPRITLVRDYVYQLCACDTHGGRIVVLGNDACVVYDIPQWTDAMVRCVLNRFPETSFTVSYTANSLTGFQVLLTLAPDKSSYIQSSTTFIIILFSAIPILASIFTGVANRV
jgi:hypothetical protein